MMIELKAFEDIQELNEFLTPFPNSDDIFVAHQSWLKDHFLPLISIDLGMLNDDWRGQVVHILNQCEDIYGYVGENTAPYHSVHCSENWLAFRLTDDNRYEFLADEGFFIRSPKNSELKAKINQEYENDIDDYFAKQQEKYQKSKSHFEKHGSLIGNNAFIDNLGGGFTWGNWTEAIDPPVDIVMNLPFGSLDYDELEELPNEGIDIRYQDNPFYFIAGVPAYNYGCSGGLDCNVV